MWNKADSQRAGMPQTWFKGSGMGTGGCVSSWLQDQARPLAVVSLKGRVGSHIRSEAEKS